MLCCFVVFCVFECLCVFDVLRSLSASRVYWSFHLLQRKRSLRDLGACLCTCSRLSLFICSRSLCDGSWSHRVCISVPVCLSDLVSSVCRLRVALNRQTVKNQFIVLVITLHWMPIISTLSVWGQISQRSFSVSLKLLPYVYAGLVRLLFPYSPIVEAIYASIMALVFCVYIIIDTQLIVSVCVCMASSIYCDLLSLSLYN